MAFRPGLGNDQIMTEPSTTFRVADLEPQDAYKLTSGLVVPRPIGWVGTVSADGHDNLAPYSFFNLIGSDPPHVAFSAGAGRRDSLNNVRAVGEFTLNIVTAETVEAMNATSASLAADDDEFDHAKLTKLPSLEIRPHRVGEATASMECRVIDIVHIGNPEGGNDLVIGEVLLVHAANRVLDGTRVDQEQLRAVGRHVGSWYSHATDLFAIDRPA
jgi:flavin reductase (DIM6/NTAB) family NADH-FMN oxidoreductase RutF